MTDVTIEAPRAKLEGGKRFVMATEFSPAGDQPTAIKEISQGVLSGEQDQVLLGAQARARPLRWQRLLKKPSALRSF